MKFTETVSACVANPETFWNDKEFGDLIEVQRYSFGVAFFAFAGFFFNYTVTGQIWNLWPFDHSTLTVQRAVQCAILQWIFYAIFPMINTLFIDAVFLRKSSLQESKQRIILTAYSLTPLCIASLFVGIPFLNRAAVLLGIATFLYSLFYGYRIVLRQTIFRSGLLTLLTYIVYEISRNIFVYVIGF